MDWNAMAAPWLALEAETDVKHAPVRHELMQRANLRAGQHVLDIGPGAGITLLDAATAVGPQGRVTGIEIAPPFADRARERSPETVDVIVADAQDHDFEPASFDAAISLFGVMFFRDSVAAFRNMRPALKPGGAMYFACWGPPARNPYFTMPAQIAAEVLGPGVAFDPTGPGPMRFGDADMLADLLETAGWVAEIETMDLHLTPAGTPADVAEALMRIGAAAMRMKQAKDEGTLTEAQRHAIFDGTKGWLEEMESDGEVRIPACVHFVRARA